MTNKPAPLINGLNMNFENVEWSYDVSLSPHQISSDEAKAKRHMSILYFRNSKL